MNQPELDYNFPENHTLDHGHKPLLMTINLKSTTSIDWTNENKDLINDIITKKGALLIRGMKINSSNQYREILTALFGQDLIKYSYRSTPRTELKGNIYTATEYYQDQVIPLHNENSYSNQWAMRIGFLCMIPPIEGGETPICDSRKIYQKIPIEIRNIFEAKGVKYVRNYSSIDLPWTEVFQTQDKLEVEQYCKSNNIAWEWQDNGELKTSQINAAVAQHPQTQEMVWFNQAHLFHISNLDKDLKENLVETLGEEKLPRHCYFGDGSPIPDEMLDTIRNVYEEEKISFNWKKGDVMLLDNMLFCHGREPFSGPRKVLVGMSDIHPKT